MSKRLFDFEEQARRLTRILIRTAIIVTLAYLAVQALVDRLL